MYPRGYTRPVNVYLGLCQSPRYGITANSACNSPILARMARIAGIRVATDPQKTLATRSLCFNSGRKGQNCQFYAISGPFGLISGSLWAILGHSGAISGHSGPEWAILGHFGLKMGHFGSFWAILGHFGPFWAHSGSFRAILATFVAKSRFPPGNSHERNT